MPLDTIPILVRVSPGSINSEMFIVDLPNIQESFDTLDHLWDVFQKSNHQNDYLFEYFLNQAGCATKQVPIIHVLEKEF